MQLRHWNWNAQRFDAIDYPDELIEPFLNWLLETHAWHEDVQLVHRRVRALRQTLATHRQLLVERAALAGMTVPLSSVPTAAVNEQESPALIAAREQRARNLANLAKAREVHRQKRAAAKGA